MPGIRRRVQRSMAESVSIGRPDRWLRWGVLEFMVTTLLFLPALPWGPVGIATAWSLSLCVLTVPALWYAGRPIRLEISPVIAAVWKFVAASLLASCVAAVIAGSLRWQVAASNSIGELTRIVKISCLFGALYLGAVIILHGGCAPLDQAAGLLRGMMPGSKSLRPLSTIAATCSVEPSQEITLVGK